MNASIKTENIEVQIVGDTVYINGSRVKDDLTLCKRNLIVQHGALILLGVVFGVMGMIALSVAFNT